MASTVRIRIEEAQTGDTCVVDVVDNDWWIPWSADDHWRMISGSLPGISVRRSSWAKLSSLLNLHSLARLQGFPSSPRAGDSGDGLLHGGGGMGVVQWTVM